ncbi:MAG: hypothetical protein ACRD5M_05035 [Candidatus Acidiferrales bacterium]
MAKRVDRVSSRRAKFYRLLRDAAVGTDDFDTNELGRPRLVTELNVRTPEEKLRFFAASADPYLDDSDTFRANILRSFRRARILNFQRLARELDRLNADELKRSVIRAFMNARHKVRPARVPEISGAGFYR